MFWGYHESFGDDYDGNMYTIIDTGATSLMISNLYYDSYIEKIMEQVPGVEWEFRDSLVYT